MVVRVFVVNSDTAFLAQATICLSRAGYEVYGFADPMAALRALERPEGVDLLITCVRFAPGMPHGVSLALMAKTARPAIQVLFTAAPDVEEYTKGIGEFLPAPVSIQDLAEAVRRLLQARDQLGRAAGCWAPVRPVL